jgi:hypothetical protein
MFITKKAIPRRTVLRGLGTTLALPFLDSMVPALTALQNTAAQPVKRLGIVYHPNGLVPAGWLPKGIGKDFTFGPTMAALEPFRDQLTVITNLDNIEADAKGDGPGDHARAGGSYLTGVHVRKSETNVEAATSMDQIVADFMERETQLGSLQLTLDSNTMVGSCDGGYSCAYSNTLSWRTPTLPLMAENDPRVVFERLFGASDSTDGKLRMLRLQQDRSLLDSITLRIAELRRQVGADDKVKIENYFQSVRDVERRIQKAEQQSNRSVASVAKPGGVPATFEDHAALMYDLQLLAYQSDLTRVITFMYGREITGRTYPALGINESHHSISHHGEDPEKLAKLAVIQAHHVNLFANYLAKLKATQDGDGTLLDHSILLYGSGISNSDRHTHVELHPVVVGGGGGTHKGGRHITYPSGTPLSNLHLTLMNKMGVRLDTLGDSTGVLKELSDL